MKILIGFFGLNRALPLTIAGIERNIFSVLRNAGIDDVRVGHFNRPDTIVSPRSGEFGTKTSNEGISQLNLDICWIEKQIFDSIAPELTTISQVPWRRDEDEGMHMRRNALWQLHSLRQLGRMAALLDTTFDLYLLLRPDLDYIDPLPIAVIMEQVQAGADLIAPSWASHNGINDRFAICTKRGFDAYTGRISHAAEFANIHKYFQSEELLAYALTKAGLNVAATDMRARRVRSNLHIVQEQFDDPA
jgi:hypothetical protein